MIDENNGGSGGVTGIEVTAQPGQLIRVKETDENGNPTAWEAVPWGYTEQQILLEESNASPYNAPGLGQMWLIFNPPTLTVGETYTVTYNGESYDCECIVAPSGIVDDPNAVALGNCVLLNGNDTGEPFAIVVSNQAVNILDIPTFTGSAAPTSVRVGIKGKVAHPIPGELLPEGVPYCVKEKVPFNFTFDGDTTGKEIIDLGEGACLVKMTDAVLTMDDLTGATLVMESGGEMTIELTADVIADINGDGSILGTDGFLAVQRDTTMEVIALTSGLYFLKIPNEICTKSLVKEGATVTASTVRKLDKRCLPDDLLNDTPKRYNVHFELSMSGNNYTATTEQTFAEVYKKAIDTNTIVKGIATISGITFVFDVAMVAETSVEFVCVDYSSASLHIYNITVASDNTVTVKAKTIS